MEEKLTFTGENGEEIELYILESTRIGGVDYILATDAASGDGDCYLFKDKSNSADSTAVYELVDDENEMDYLLSVFAELLDDVDLEF
ncbi:DUF1292 domain-containing protein [Cuneatibacter sp. NSJ-177]|uniref:DUF1292 domain-containing protein n=1 Tax=Cuneatibacter sp. NSJ-177 TaxID=2931401 RepID=UPI001FD33DD7|nr:DUF1292 domain-containing protein [Cuneatibacter sp. NSJ-177]